MGFNGLESAGLLVESKQLRIKLVIGNHGTILGHMSRDGHCLLFDADLPMPSVLPGCCWVGFGVLENAILICSGP